MITHYIIALEMPSGKKALYLFDSGNEAIKCFKSFSLSKDIHILEFSTLDEVKDGRKTTE